jgi:hypothetical protein
MHCNTPSPHRLNTQPCTTQHHHFIKAVREDVSIAMAHLCMSSLSDADATTSSPPTPTPTPTAAAESAAAVQLRRLITRLSLQVPFLRDLLCSPEDSETETEATAATAVESEEIIIDQSRNMTTATDTITAAAPVTPSLTQSVTDGFFLCEICNSTVPVSNQTLHVLGCKQRIDSAAAAIAAAAATKKAEADRKSEAKAKEDAEDERGGEERKRARLLQRLASSAPEELVRARLVLNNLLRFLFLRSLISHYDLCTISLRFFDDLFTTLEYLKHILLHTAAQSSACQKC